MQERRPQLRDLFQDDGVAGLGPDRLAEGKSEGAGGGLGVRVELLEQDLL